MRDFLPLLAEKFVKTPKHGGFFEKVGSLAKSTIFPVLLRNEALFQLLAEKFVKTPKHGGFFEMLQVFAESIIFCVFSRNEALFATFPWKVRQNAETRWFLPKLASFRKIDDFSCFFTKWGTFCLFLVKSSIKRPKHGGFFEKARSFGQIDDFSRFSAKWGSSCDFCVKSSSKRRNTVVSSKKLQVLRNRRFFPFFREMSHSLQLLAKKFVKTPKHGGFFQKCPFFAKPTSCRVFSRNEALFATFGGKVCQNPETRCFLRKESRFGQIDYFSCFFTKWESFCHFWLKSSAKRWNTVVFSKTSKFWPNRRFSVFFHEMRNFLPLLAEKFGKTPKHGGFFEKCPVLAKSTIFRVFSRNEELFATFGSKVRQDAKTRWFLRKVSSFGQIDHFSCFSAKFATFCEYWLKRSSKRRNTVVASNSWKFWPNRRFFVFLCEMRHFLQHLAEKFVKTPKNGGFFEKCPVLAKSTIFRVFSAKFANFCKYWLNRSSKRRNTVVASKSLKFWPNRRFFVFFRKMRHFLRLLCEKFVKTPKHDDFFDKLATFAQIDDFSRFSTKWETFCHFWLKSSSKRRNTVVSSKKLQVFAKSTIFPLFSRNEALFATSV